jgi:polysaccharide pyruvyl transferase WcaK-like protein
MRVIAILDPSVGTENVGDEIIYDSVRREVDALFNSPLVIRVSSHEFMLWETRRLLAKAEHIFLGGSNLLKSKMEWNTQWKLSPMDLFGRLNAIALGCGWKHYDGNPTPYTRMLYSRSLSQTKLHSVRDGMSASQLAKAGVPHVANTACVTMWNLTPEHCATLPAIKAEAAVITLTEYHADRHFDRYLVETVFAKYKDVHLFVQQPEDFAYGIELAPRPFASVVSSLKAYDAVLSGNVDYLGTRLHGGIRAIQKGKRTLIVGIDNRAAEITRDTGLPVIFRGELCERLLRWIDTPAATTIRLPVEAISRWRGQFAPSDA